MMVDTKRYLCIHKGQQKEREDELKANTSIPKSAPETQEEQTYTNDKKFKSECNHTIVATVD